jgi:hypothetical protein
VPFNGNGQFVRVHNWTSDAANAIDINATEMDAEDNGFAAGLSNCVTRDGQGQMSADFLPSVTNEFNLGTASKAWETLNGIPISTLPITQAAIGAIYSPLTPLEVAANVTLGNGTIPSHEQIGIIMVDRYITPSMTDDGLALQAAINVLFQAVGSGHAGIPIRFMAGAYNIVTLPTFPHASSAVPLDIGGAGIWATQLVNAAPPYPATGSGALFDMGNLDGWALHDFMMTGSSANKNDGIYAGDVSFTIEQISWRIENVAAYMAGVGLQIANTNDGIVRNFRCWENNPPAFIVPAGVAVVTPSDVGHHIHLTGGFVNLVSIYDVVCPPSRNFFGGLGLHRGILLDASSSLGLKIDGADVESYGGNQTAIVFTVAPTGTGGSLTGWTGGAQTGTVEFSDGELRIISVGSGGAVTWTGALTGAPIVNATINQTEVGIQINPSGACQGLTLKQIYLAQTQVQLAHCSFCDLTGIEDDGSYPNGGTLVLGNACRTNVITGCSVDGINESSAANYGNTYIGTEARSAWVDFSTGPVSRRINCIAAGPLVADWGGTDSVNLTVTGGVLSGSINCFQSRYWRIVENDATNWSVPLPLNPTPGFDLQIDIINASGGAGPAITFTSAFHMTSNTPAGPTNGNQSTYRFTNQGSHWAQQFAPAATVPD